MPRKSPAMRCLSSHLMTLTTQKLPVANGDYRVALRGDQANAGKFKV
jgi:hypothetical protein